MSVDSGVDPCDDPPLTSVRPLICGSTGRVYAWSSRQIGNVLAAAAAAPWNEEHGKRKREWMGTGRGGFAVNAR